MVLQSSSLLPLGELLAAAGAGAPGAGGAQQGEEATSPPEPPVAQLRRLSPSRGTNRLQASQLGDADMPLAALAAAASRRQTQQAGGVAAQPQPAPQLRVPPPVLEQAQQHSPTSEAVGAASSQQQDAARPSSISGGSDAAAAGAAGSGPAAKRRLTQSDLAVLRESMVQLSLAPLAAQQQQHGSVAQSGDSAEERLPDHLVLQVGPPVSREAFYYMTGSIVQEPETWGCAHAGANKPAGTAGHPQAQASSGRPAQNRWAGDCGRPAAL